jgi:hypothetical protein
MPLPTNEPEHFEDWRPFFGYTDLDGCVVNTSFVVIFFSGNSKLVQWFKTQVHSLSSWLTRKEILGICKLSI